MKKVLLAILIGLISCSNTDTNNQGTRQLQAKKSMEKFDKTSIESNFTVVSLDEINNKKFIPNKDFSIDIPYDILADVFLEPVNEVEFSKSYIRNKNTTGHKYKLSDSVWILGYQHYYDLHDYDWVWILYNSKDKTISSKIIIEGITKDFYREFKGFDGSVVTIYTKYNRHFENGMEGNNSKPIEIESTYIIKDNKFVLQ